MHQPLPPGQPIERAVLHGLAQEVGKARIALDLGEIVVVSDLDQ